jgi:cytochrome c peroxidase
MHAGQLATLRDVVRHYSELDMDRVHADGEALLRPLKLSEGEIDDLVAFLETLTDSQSAAALLQTARIAGCSP